MASFLFSLSAGRLICCLLKEVYGFEPPHEHGYDVVTSIKTMHEEKAKVFFAMGGNFLSATPDTNYTPEALRKCDLTVHVSTKFNRSHFVHGKEALILPCLGRSDKDEHDGIGSAALLLIGISMKKL